MEVGDYIRTSQGYIAKIEEITNTQIRCDNIIYVYWNTYCFLKIENQNLITKYSKNIIDLLEVGDIIQWEAKDIGYYGVNEVIRRPETKKTLGVYPEEYDYLLPLERLKIIKVLTREQFEENSYEMNYG